MGRGAVLLLLLLLALGATWAARAGIGAAPLDRDAEVRAGSIGGPAVVGRGPRVGK